MEEKIRELEKFAVIGKIFPGIFHDVLNPLTGMMLYIDSLENTEGIKEQVDKLSESSNNIRDLIKIVQKFIYSENSDSIRVDQVVRDVMKLMSSKIKESNVKIHYIQSGNILLNSPPLFMYQILINLISNAIDAIKESGKKDGVVNVITKRKGNDIMIQVIDNGIGIENLKILNIFQPFYTTKNTGVGTGLTNIKNIIENELKGKIEVKSKINFGTEFKIQIPLKNPG